jgi:group I intron endonuclease
MNINISASNELKSGIYKISNSIDGRVYIGSAVLLKRRANKHKSELLRGVHPNKHLQSFAGKYGIGALFFSVLELAETTQLLEREEYYIRLFTSNLTGFNQRVKATSNLGIKFPNRTMSLEGRAKLSKAKKGLQPLLGFKHSEASKKKISAIQKGKKLTPEWISNRTAAQKGKIGKPVICLNSGTVYNSAAVAALELNIDFKKISLVCKGVRKTTGGMTFRFYDKATQSPIAYPNGLP